MTTTEIYPTEIVEKMKFWLYQSLIGICFEKDADDWESTINKHSSEEWDEETPRQDNNQTPGIIW